MDLQSTIEKSEIKKELPLFPNRDFDLVFDKFGWPVGTSSNVPEEFLRKLLAGSTTYHMANVSIDNVYKRHFKDKSFKVHNGSRLDYRVDRFLRLHMDSFDLGLEKLSSATLDGPFGRTISGWTLLRLSYNGKLLITCAQRGALLSVLTWRDRHLNKLLGHFELEI